MTTETIQWFTPEEQMPESFVSLLGMFNVSETSLCFECFYDIDDDKWVVSDTVDNPVPTHWCYIPQGPNDSTLAG